MLRGAVAVLDLSTPLLSAVFYFYFVRLTCTISLILEKLLEYHESGGRGFRLMILHYDIVSICYEPYSYSIISRKASVVSLKLQPKHNTRVA